MASSNNSMSYTGRDIVSIRKELINTIPTLTDKWTDFNESDLGMVLIELMAGVQDMQNFYLDTQALKHIVILRFKIRMLEHYYVL